MTVHLVGAGPGGLASAMLLAHAGLEVTVLERRDVVGGRTSALEAEGFRFSAVGDVPCQPDQRARASNLELRQAYLYRKLGESGGNLFFSPLSLSTALAMTSAGAAGEGNGPGLRQFTRTPSPAQ